MRFLLASFMALLVPALGNAQSLEGRWLSSEFDGVRSVIEISPCEQGLCGIIVGTQGGTPAQGIVGHRILWGFEDQGDGTYSRGKLKPPGGAPQLNATIRSLSQTEVVMRGCLLLICRNETLTRI